MIEVENLTKKYGSHVAVVNLSFRVERGMIYDHEYDDRIYCGHQRNSEN